MQKCWKNVYYFYTYFLRQNDHKEVTLERSSHHQNTETQTVAMTWMSGAIAGTYWKELAVWKGWGEEILRAIAVRPGGAWEKFRSVALNHAAY